MASAAMTPEARLKKDAEDARDAAKKSAEKAATSESNAANAASKAENEVEKPKRIAWLTFVVSVLVLGSIGYQGSLMQDSVNLTKDQMRVGFLQQMRADKERLQLRLNDSTSAFSELHALDSGCDGGTDLSPSKQISVSVLIQQTLEHYQYYYSMTSALDLRSDWQEICGTAKQQMNTFCHLENRLKPLLKKGTPEFKEAFNKCDFPYRSEP